MTQALTVSIVVPVRNGGEAFACCLRALAATDPPPLEIIVADDGSEDDSAALAGAAGARVVTLQERSGPAAARNSGAKAAGGDVVLFIDADVAVPRGIVGQIGDLFVSRPALAAAIGSYDEVPADPGFLSQYKNLYQRFMHQTSREDAFTFWGACGAIRRDVFVASGGFDERYRQPSIEDIELGYRLRASGHRIALEKTLEVTHLKRWTARSLIVSDVFRRAAPWSALILRHRRLHADLNLRRSHRVAVLAAVLLAVMLALSWRSAAARAAAAGLALLLLALDAPLVRFFFRRKGLWFCARALAWQWFHYVCCGLVFGAACGWALTPGTEEWR